MQKQRYTSEFREQALAKVFGRSSDQGIREVAASLNMSVATLKGWMLRATPRQKVPSRKGVPARYTSRRAYRFEYSASTRKPDPRTDQVMYAVRFEYPPQYATHAGPTSAELADRALDAGAAGRKRNLDYWFCGSPTIKPVAASDDGVHTRLTFGARSELPALFVRNDDGSESLLNFSIENGDVVIHRVAARFILRRGQLTGCVVNKGYSGSGERLRSGTVAPDVQRDRKEPVP